MLVAILLKFDNIPHAGSPVGTLDACKGAYILLLHETEVQPEHPSQELHAIRATWRLVLLRNREDDVDQAMAVLTTDLMRKTAVVEALHIQEVPDEVGP